MNNPLESILDGVQHPQTPGQYVECLAILAQTAIDGCIAGHRLDAFTQNMAIQEVLSRLKEAITAYVRTDPVPCHPLTHEDDLSILGAEQTPHWNPQTKETLKDYADELAYAAEKLAADDKTIQTVVPILPGGIKPAALAASQFGVDTLLPVRYSSIPRKNTPIQLPSRHYTYTYGAHITSRHVLVCEDSVVSGASLAAVINWLLDQKPASIHASFISQTGRGRQFYDANDFAPEKITGNLYRIEPHVPVMSRKEPYRV